MDMKPLKERKEIARGPHFDPVATRGLRLCLAASGGGHVRQLLDLESVWSRYDYFFVSEDSALARSLAATHPMHFVSHFAYGQAKLFGPLRMLAAGIRNFLESARIMLRERPDIIISTGAGSMFFSVLWARLFGAKFVLIESFARFDKPSLFGRMASPLAQYKIVQSKALAPRYPDAMVCDPLEILGDRGQEKKPLLFVTVGATLPFDRMVETVARLKANGEIPEDVVIQTGIGGIKPEGLVTFETLPFERMLAYLRDADIVVCHGGTGSLITALREGCRTIVMPRLFEKGEHYDDHQSEITNAFAVRGLVVPANTAEELAAALRTVRARAPLSATTNPAKLAGHLGDILSRHRESKLKGAA
ncbi:MAG TPA: glycosyltransferase [Rhizomicrobium sp.]|nr:glycosyltransferase [Rhizomicrobium sp.]